MGGHDLVWRQLDGSPIDAGTERREWKAILKLAGVRDARIHDGRHTAATMLLLHGVDELRVEASRRLSELLYDPEVPAVKPKKKDKDKKARKQAKRKNVTIEGGGYATDLATGPGEAKIIPFRRPA